MIRSYRYRLHPNVVQAGVLLSWLRFCCSLWNAALDQRIIAWRNLRRSIRYIDQTAQLTELRVADPAWALIPVEVLRSPLQRLQLAYEAFFRRVKLGEKPGFPRFKAVRRYDSFSTGPVKVKKDRVFVPRLGHIRFNLYRPIEGVIKNAVIRRDRAGKWWVTFQCDLGPAPVKIEVKAQVGIDLGLSKLVTLSTGEQIANPRFAKRGAVRLRACKRSLSRKKSGSKNYEKARILSAKAEAHVANQRLDYARKEAKKLFATYDEVMHEEFDLRKFMNSRFSKSFADASWGILLRCLASKAEEAGKHLTPKDPRGTTQRCSRCGANVPKTIADRWHSCSHCGLEIDRDHNGALNVLTARPARSGVGRGPTGSLSAMKEKPRV